MRTRPLPARAVFEALLSAFGPQRWWPAESDTEMMVGAVLVQNTAWIQAERAIANLKRGRWLNWHALALGPTDRLAECIRPSGYPNMKARRLQNLARWMVDQHDGRHERLFALPTPALREGLLSVNGVGPETADCILLYAARRSVFVVDAYTRRVLKRHHWAHGRESVQEIAGLFTAALPADTALFNEYHALLVAVGKNHCRAKPDCQACPLRRWLPRNPT